MKTRTYRVLLALWMVLLPLLPVTPAQAGEMRQYDSPYYRIYTDLDADAEREAAIRMTKMAEEYHERTKGFSGVIRQKFPFYLFRNREDYMRAGGLPGTAGVYRSNGNEGMLMAVAGAKMTMSTWHVVQHEGFHQFAHAVIGGDLPTWLNEGLAEYFGEGIFTGDSFVTGVVPGFRRIRIASNIENHKFKSIRAMMTTSAEQWAGEMSIENYDQAWSMVHFLVHGDGGKYQQPFSAFIVELGRGKPWDRAWLDTMGPAGQFEERWRDYWMTLPKNPTEGLYAKASAAILTSFLARSAGQKQTFDTYEEFRTAASAHQLKIADADWLPPNLLDAGLELSGRLGDWTLQNQNKDPKKPCTLVCVTPNGIKVTSTFFVKAGKIDHANIEVDDLAKTVTDAKALIDAGHKDRAKALLLEGLKALPKSLAAEDARKLVAELK